MKSLAVCHKGLESIAAEEIKELLGRNVKDIKTGESVVIFGVKSHMDLCLLCYKAQSLMKVMLLLDSFRFMKIEDISARAEKIAESKELKNFIGRDTKFKASCTRTGTQGFSSGEIENAIGEHIKGIVDLEEPEAIIHAYVCDDMCHIGIDFSGFDLSKRQYRIFTYKDSLKATVAYSLLRIAGYSRKDFLLDPFCGAGTILIEAALYATGLPVNHYSKDRFAFLNFGNLKADFEKFFEKIDRKADLKVKTSIHGYDPMLGYVKSAQKNAKIAGVNKSISITRADIGWMDTKVKEKEADRIVTVLPEITERNSKAMEKTYKEFFYQADFVLRKKGIIVLVSNSAKLVEKYANEYKFSLRKRMVAMQGKKHLDIFIIQK